MRLQCGPMEFAILGPLRVSGPDGSIDINAPKQRALLAMLLIEHRRDVVARPSA